MKKSLFVFIFVLGISFANMCTAEGTYYDITYNNISKIYVEYEDGDYQEIALNNISYTYQVYQLDDEHIVHSIVGQQTLLVTGELNKNVKISRVALYMESFTVQGEGTYTINGYLAYLGGNFGKYYGVTGIPITNWLSGRILPEGDFTELNSGVVDFNTGISSADGETITYTHNNSFNAVDKSVILQIQQCYYVIGGISTTN